MFESLKEEERNEKHVEFDFFAKKMRLKYTRKKRLYTIKTKECSACATTF